VENSPWLESAKQTMATLKRYAQVFRIGKPRYQCYQGMIEWLSGNPEKAHGLWLQALNLAESYGMVLEQGLIHFTIGKHLSHTNPARLDYLRKALALFQQCGAGYHTEQTKQELALPN